MGQIVKPGPSHSKFQSKCMKSDLKKKMSQIKIYPICDQSDPLWDEICQPSLSPADYHTGARAAGVT